MLHEISRQAVHTNKREDVILSWHNSKLTVRHDKGIQIYDISQNLRSLVKRIDCVETFIPSPNYSPASSCFSKQFLQRKMNNNDLTEMIIDPGLWPHSAHLTQELANIVTFEWSPVGLIHSNECVLAVLNNIGGIEILGSGRHSWKSVLNLSLSIKEHYSPPEGQKARLTTLNAVKEAVNAVETSAICFGSEVSKSSCYFVTAQKNGKILIWLLENRNVEVAASLQGELDTDCGEIISLLWIPKLDNFLLMCSNVVGQIFALDCHIKVNIKLVQTIILWTHKDQMIAKHLLHTVIDDQIILFYNKHRHLIIQVLDKCCNVISQTITNVNDYKIMDLKGTSQGFYILTVNGKIFKINLTISDGDLNCNLLPIEIKDSYPNYEFYNISLSANSVIWAIAMYDRRIMSRKEPKNLEIVLLIADTPHDSEISLLLNNPTKQLSNYLDCIELIRYKSMKMKGLPKINFDQFYAEANNDLYKMKIYLILVILYNTMERVAKNGTKGLLPETSEEVIREKIFTSHACKTLIRLFNKKQPLVSFELEYYIAAKKYLEYICKKTKTDLIELVPVNVLNMTKKTHEYICQCCNEKIDGMTCKDGHMNMFCSLTFTPIESDSYLVCSACGSLARIEIYGDRPMCLFCDLYFKFDVSFIE